MSNIVTLQSHGEAKNLAGGGFGFEIAGIDASGVFLPDRALPQLNALSDAVWRRRQLRLLMRAATLERAMPAGYEDSGLAEAIAGFRAMPQSRRQLFVEHPELRAWLLQVDRLVTGPLTGPASPEVLDTCRQLKTILSRFSAGLNGAGSSNDIYMRRFDVEPGIAEVAPPSYDFSGAASKTQAHKDNPYTVELAAEVVKAALQRISVTWPGLEQVIPRYVRMIVHLPDAEFRSCSAQRFAGVIMLTTSDETLLAFEESLVHEFGHQVLYAVMELEPLIAPGKAGMFTLPWSGSVRDAYGYFHATYIYLILALFLEASRDRYAEEKPAVEERLREILKGLSEALPDFDGAEFFTPAGTRFFEHMRRHSGELLGRNVHLMSEN